MSLCVILRSQYSLFSSPVFLHGHFQCLVVFCCFFLFFFGKEGSQEIKSKEIQISGNECKMSIHCVIFDNEEE